MIRADTPLTALAEARRLACGEVAVEVITDTQFGEVLARSYSTGQSAAEQVAQGLDDELDLMSLAEQVPQTADLLEQEGDAPIIRLINALLREAMRESLGRAPGNLRALPVGTHAHRRPVTRSVKAQA